MGILLKADIVSRLKISQATLYRWVNDSRAGRGTFPLPITERGQTLRWNADDIDTWCTAKIKPQSTKTPKTKRLRQEAVKKGMLRHGFAQN
jgi:predicted DNA-binding transcriptional regulator AlpA